jgi:hypothetical protein
MSLTRPETGADVIWNFVSEAGKCVDFDSKEKITHLS